MGILLADGRNGPFRFEIQYISALAELDPSLYANAPEQIIAGERAPPEPQEATPHVEQPGQEIIRPHAAWTQEAMQSSGMAGGVHASPGEELADNVGGSRGRSPAEEAAARRAALREAAKLE